MKYEFSGNFHYYVLLIKRLYLSTLTKAASECGLTLSEADVLSFLRQNSEFDTARDIALYRDVSKAYVSGAIEKLIERGFISTQQDKNDRRLQHLSITDKGEPSADILYKAIFAFYDNVTSNLTDEEISQMLKLIGKCAVALQTAKINE
jgi:MarR family transcriptional regulator for hemolysin